MRGLRNKTTKQEFEGEELVDVEDEPEEDEEAFLSLDDDTLVEE